MQKLYTILAVLLCIAFTVSAQATLKLEVHAQSNNWWVAVASRDAGRQVSNIELKQNAEGAEWVSLKPTNNPWWKFYIYHADDGKPVSLPLSFRVTASTGSQIVFDSAVTSFTGAIQMLDSLQQFTDAQEPTAEPTEAPAPATDAPVPATEAPVPATEAPIPATEASIPATEAPIPATEAPAPATDAPVPATDAPTSTPSAAPSAAPTSAPTAAPTAVPATREPTRAPSAAPTSAPTSAPTAYPTSEPTARPSVRPSVAATTRPTTAPVSGCGGKTKILVPLYVYPGAAWDKVIAGAAKVPTTVIINPNSGPSNGPNAAYVTYMDKMYNAGVDMTGYVYTQYGNRPLATVKRDIDVYAASFPLLKGIFLDEVASGSDKEAYYKELYDYILGMPGWTYDIINPGTPPTAGYMAASTMMVSLENYGSSGAGDKPNYASCNNKNHFSAIVHTVGSGAMRSTIDNLMNQQYFGYLYITDGPGGCCTYNYLTNYYSDMVDYIASKQ